jgi:F-type H+-transporting ATPase subunit gamma
MASLRDLKRRIKSVEGIRQITRAMQMVSVTKLHRAQMRIEAARPYTDKMDEILAHLSQAVQAGIVLHPLMVPRSEVKKLMIVAVASSKGLCGSFNANVIRQVESRYRELGEKGIEATLFPIGKKLHDFFRRRGRKLHPGAANYRNIDQQLPLELLGDLTDISTNAFEAGEIDQVDLVYSEFISAIQHKVVLRQFLPIIGLGPKTDETGEKKEMSRDYIFEPAPDQLFSLLIPKYARVVTFRMLADSLASEHGARMNAMRNATDNAADMIRELTLYRNKARQAAITKELSEIVGGSEALRG